MTQKSVCLGWRRIQRELEYFDNSNHSNNKASDVCDNNQVNGNKMTNATDTTIVKIIHINSSTSSSIPSKLFIFFYWTIL